MHFKIYVTSRPTILHGRSLPEGAICYQDLTDLSWYVFTRFPDYHGKRTPDLSYMIYDSDFGWDPDPMYRCSDKWLHYITSIVWHYHQRHHMSDTIDYTSLMKHDRRHKRGTGGRRIEEIQSDFVPKQYYKQVTDCAYWANLNDAKSGNASVVASHIR